MFSKDLYGRLVPRLHLARGERLIGFFHERGTRKEQNLTGPTASKLHTVLTRVSRVARRTTNTTRCIQGKSRTRTCTHQTPRAQGCKATILYCGSCAKLLLKMIPHKLQAVFPDNRGCSSKSNNTSASASAATIVAVATVAYQHQ